ncbi:MAG: DnaJ domain-containing protein [Cyanobacteria bacterium P01_D01_bin.1]
MASSSGDYYRRLNLSPQASYQEIKAAFRRLARQYHPDLHPDQPGAIARFQAIQEAYEVLRDRIQRQYYDQTLPQRQSRDSHRNSASSSPRTADEYYLRGIRSAVAHAYEDAIAHYTQAIVLDSQFIEAYLRRAEVRYVLDDDSGVLVDCQRAIALHTQTTHAQDRHTIDSQIYYYQGMARYRLGYVESAIAAYSDAIRHDCEDARYFYRRGIAYQDLHSYGEAFRDIKRSAQLYHDQGDLASYHHLRQVLSTFKKSGRSLPVRLIQQITRRRHRHPKAKRSNQTKTSGASLSGHIAILKLLSNPAGELVPLYRQLNSHQTNIVGYGLAILANLCFVLGGVQHFEDSSWLVASWLWVSGGLTFVAMVLAVSLAKIWLRIQGAWAADIFILGTTLVPLGLLAVVSALLPDAAQLVAGDRGPWLAHISLLIAALWALSHAVMAIQNGLSQIHPGSGKTVAWLAPVVLGLGLAAGMTTWGLLANGNFS